MESTPSHMVYFYLFFETESCCISQTGLERLGSSDPLPQPPE
jgi:hypothetical protein